MMNPPKPRLLFQGRLQGHSPEAQFNRFLCQDILKQGDFVLQIETWDQDKDSPLPEDLRPCLISKSATASEAFEITLSAYPRFPFSPPTQGHWIWLQPWAYGALPQIWLDPLRSQVDQIWVHTPENRRDYIQAGVAAQRIQVIPWQMTDTPTPKSSFSLPSSKERKILFYGPFDPLSGLDLLLSAYADEFLPDENLCLVVYETHPSPQREQLIETLNDLIANPEVANICWLQAPLSEAEQMALFTACDAVVWPFRADPIGRVSQLAHIHNRPLIISQSAEYLGQRLSETNQLATRRIQQREAKIGPWPTQGCPHWLQPHPPQLRHLLRLTYENKLTPTNPIPTSTPPLFQSPHKALKKVSTLPPRHSIQSKLRTHLLAGLEALEAGKTELAQSAFEAALSLDPTHTTAGFDLASTLLEQKEYTQALHYFQKLLPQSPQHPALYHAIGYCLYQLNHLPLAHRYFKQALRLNPELAIARENLEIIGKPSDSLTSSEPNAFQVLMDWIGQAEKNPIALLTPSLSLCMIVKNEAQFLGQCLTSVRDIVDEIIVVDTGSEDETKEIAQSYGAQVFDFTWCDDFSQARNHALSKAQSDWILVLDADEVLTPEAQSILPNLLSRPPETLTGYQCKIHNFRQETHTQDVVEHYMLRLFPNHPDLKYQGQIHEQLVCEDETLGFQIQLCPDLCIYHYGYTGKTMQERNKFTRNLNLIQQAIEANPDHPFHHFNLGLTYRVMGKSKPARQALQKARQLLYAQNQTPPYLSACIAYLAALEVEGGQFETALALCRQAPDICQSNPDYWLNYASALLGSGAYEEALTRFEKALALRARPFISVVYDQGAITWKPLLGIAQCYLRTQDWERADQCLRRALKASPEQEEVLLGLIRLQLFLNQPTAAETYLQQLNALGHPNTNSPLVTYEAARYYSQLKDWTKASQYLEVLQEHELPSALATAVQVEYCNVLLKQNKLPQALPLLEALVSDNAEAERLFHSLSQFYLQNEAWEKALEIYTQLCLKNPSPRHFCNRGIVLLQLGRDAEAKAEFEKTRIANPENYIAHHHLGVIALHQEDLNTAKTQYHKVLSLKPDYLYSLLDLAKIALHEHDFAEAQHYLERTLTQAENNIEILDLLAFCLYQQGQFETASSVYLDILELNPHHGHTLIQLGYLLRNQGHLSEALQLFERALQTESDNVLLFNGIGSIFLELGRYADARNAFLKADQLAPNQPEIQKGLLLAHSLAQNPELETHA